MRELEPSTLSGTALEHRHIIPPTSRGRCAVRGDLTLALSMSCRTSVRLEGLR